MADFPTIHMDHRRAQDAYEVHQALVKAEAADRGLKNNPHWQLLRMDAFEAFCRAFEVKHDGHSQP